MVTSGRETEMTHERIEINPEIMFGKPVIRGTRITVEQILRKLAGKMTPDEILAEFDFVIGSVHSDPAGMVLLETRMGGERIVEMPAGEDLPRIC